MQAAQSLYENGHITYMRTDSTTLAAVAVQTARQLVASQYGPEYLPDQPRYYQTKVKNAQEAHEAIRPAGHPFDFPEALRRATEPGPVQALRPDLEADGGQPDGRRPLPPHHHQRRGRRGGVPGQRPDDRLSRLSCGPTSRARTIRKAAWPTATWCCPAWRWARRWSAAASSPRATPPSRPTATARPRSPGPWKRWASAGPAPTPRSSTPSSPASTSSSRSAATCWCPPGRPSPFRSCSKPTCPTWSITSSPPRWRTSWTPSAAANSSHLEYLKRFYFGNDHPGLKEQLKNKVDEIDARDVSRVLVGKPEGQPEVFVRVGRYGPFLEQGDRRAAVPDKMPPDELTLAVALEMLDKAVQSDEPLGICPADAQADLREGRPLRPLRAARHGRGRREAAKRLAAEGHERRRRDPRSGAEAALAAPHARRSIRLRRSRWWPTTGVTGPT